MTARFLLNLREWDHRMSNPETDEWDNGRGGDGEDIRFKKSEPRATQWTINDVLADDPLLRPPVAPEIDIPSRGASLSRTGQ